MSSNKVNQGTGKNFASWWTQQNNGLGPWELAAGEAWGRGPDEHRSNWVRPRRNFFPRWRTDGELAHYLLLGLQTAVSLQSHCPSWRSLLWRSHSWVYPSANFFSEQFHQKWRQISLRHFFMVCYVIQAGACFGWARGRKEPLSGKGQGGSGADNQWGCFHPGISARVRFLPRWAEGEWNAFPWPILHPFQRILRIWGWL